MNRGMKPLLAGMVILTAAAVQAEIININLSGARDSNLDVLLNGTSASMPVSYTGTYWNDITDGVTTGTDLLDTDGNATTVDLTSAPSADYYQTAAGLEVLQRYRYFSGNASSVGTTITLEGLGAGTEWDIYLLSQGDANGRTTRFALGEGTLLANSSISANDNSNALVQDANATDYTTTAWTENNNYVKFSAAAADIDGKIVIEAASLSGSNRGSLNGIQLIAVPEPATLGMVAAFGGAVLFIRRRFMM